MRRLIVEADGGSRGNPGPAGYGALVRDAVSGSILARRNDFLGRATNNVAEYRGLIAGLQAAAEIDAEADVEVRMDSKLVVEQMSGRWQVKHPDMRPLAREAGGLAARLAKVRYTWMPRAQNADADALANQAMDARRSTAAALDDRPVEPAARQPTLGWSVTTGSPTRLLLLRHGQTTMSVDRRFSGIGDPVLTEVGRWQAAQAASRLAARGGIDAIISSPLSRTRDTAAAVAEALGVRVEVDAAWTEVDFGDWEGLTLAEVRDRDAAALDAWWADPQVAPPRGESFAAATRRVSAGRDTVVAAYEGKTVLVVSHVTPIKVVTRLALLAPPEALFRLHLDLCSLTTVDLYAGGPSTVRGLNDTAHLD